MSEDQNAGQEIIPRVFVSYAYENPDHKRWVATLAADLRRNGIDVILDQWEVRYGSDITLFMENGIRSSDRVLLVCTPTYGRKANEAKGGVGYERLVVTGEMAQNIETNKFICVLRSGSKDESLPAFAKSRIFVDFTDDATYTDAVEQLLRDLHNVPVNPKPPLGSNPFKGDRSKSVLVLRPSADRTDLEPSPDTEEAFARAEILLRQKDLMGWRRLVRASRSKLGLALVNWRQLNDLPEWDAKAFNKALYEAVELSSPLMVLALSAIDSGIEDLQDQRGLLDDFINVPNWNLGGRTAFTQAPDVLAYTYHHVLGSFLIETQLHSRVLELLNMSISHPRSMGSTTTLWQMHALMGWAKSLNGDCYRSWEFITSLPKAHRWIYHFFVDDRSYLDSLRAYLIIGSLVEFAHFTKSGETTSGAKPRIPTLNVPPLFLRCEFGSNDFERAFVKAVPDHDIVDRVASMYQVSSKQLRTSWPNWTKCWVDWHRHASDSHDVCHWPYMEERVPPLP